MSALRFQIAVASVALIYPLIMTNAMLSGGETVLRLVCEDDGLPSHCNGKPQVAAVSRFNIINMLAGALCMLASNGLLCALADRWGRKVVLTIAFMGTLVDYGMWCAILVPGGGFIRDNWRIFLPIASGVSGMLGGVFMIFFCVFALASDYTRHKPESRAAVFALIEGCMGLGAIIGAQVSGHLMDQGPFYAFVLSQAGVVVVTSIVTVVLVDTTPPELKGRTIDPWQANFVGTMMVMCPTARTRRMRSDDAVQTYEELCQTALSQHLSASTVSSGGDSTGAGAGEGELALAAAEAGLGGVGGMDYLPPYRSNDDENEHDTQGGVLDSAIMANDHNSSSGSVKSKSFAKTTGNEAPLFTPESSLLPLDLSHPLVASSPSAQQLIMAQAELPPPPAPPGNAMLLLAATALLSITGLIGYKIVYVSFLKQEFDFSDKAISNLSTIENTCRALGSFVLVPLLHRRIQSRLGELRTMQIMFILMGLAYAAVAFAQVRWQVFVCFCFATFVSSVPMGFIRGLISTEVGVLLQGKVLAAIAVMEIITGLLAGTCFSAVFSATNSSFPGTVHIMCGTCVVIAGLAPLLITDSKEVFNSRRKRTKPSDKSEDSDVTSSSSSNQVAQRHAVAAKKSDGMSEALLLNTDDFGAFDGNSLNTAEPEHEATQTGPVVVSIGGGGGKRKGKKGKKGVVVGEAAIN